MFCCIIILYFGYAVVERRCRLWLLQNTSTLSSKIVMWFRNFSDWTTLSLLSPIVWKKDRRAVSKEILKHRFLKVGANKRKLDCTKPDKPPYVCNGCLNKTSCKQNQYIYEASIAQNEYEKTLRHERSRLQVSKETIAAINDIIVPLHSIHFA